MDWLLICKSVISKRILLNTLSSHWPFPLHHQKKKSLFSPWLTAKLILLIAFLLASRGATPSLAWKLSSICSILNDLSYLYLLLMAAAFQYSIAVRYFAFAVFPNCFHRSPKTFGHTLGGVVTGFIPVLLCSIFRHCHLLLPRFSPSPHLPILPQWQCILLFLLSPLLYLFCVVQEFILTLFSLSLRDSPIHSGSFSLVFFRGPPLPLHPCSLWSLRPACCLYSDH